MKRTLAAVAVCSLLLLSAANAQDPAPAPPDWRKLKTTNAFLWKYLNREAKRFEVPLVPLIQHFAESAKVAIKFDEPTLSRVAPMHLVIGEGAEAPLQFDLCQIALAPRFSLLPEGGPGRFTVCPIADVPSRAPRVAETDLDTLAAQEWAWVTLDLGGRDARAVERALMPQRSLSGRIEAVNGGRTVLVLDIAANLRRMKSLIPDVDFPRDPVTLVPYQRGAKSDVAKLVPHLRALLVLFARNAALNEEAVSLAYDSVTGVVSGMIPTAFAGTLDAAIEAADGAAARKEADAAASDKRFVQFSLSAPEGMDVLAFTARLRLLFETEANLGDARFVPKDEKSPTLYIRCRPWLEAEVREAAALMGG